MNEIAFGDENRIAEVKAWLKKGMSIADVRKKLEVLGFNEYHVAVLLEAATGKSFVPKKPMVIIDTGRIKVIGVLLVMAVVAAVLVKVFLLG